jgi:hypothetical protein
MCTNELSLFLLSSTSTHDLGRGAERPGPICSICAVASRGSAKPAGIEIYLEQKLQACAAATGRLLELRNLLFQYPDLCVCCPWCLSNDVYVTADGD